MFVFAVGSIVFGSINPAGLVGGTGRNFTMLYSSTYAKISVGGAVNIVNGMAARNLWVPGGI